MSTSYIQPDLRLAVDQTFGRRARVALTSHNREDLREQHAIGEEIADLITQGAISTGVDEDELDEELEGLQQEVLDERMLKTGTVPVADSVQRLPNVAVGEGE